MHGEAVSADEEVEEKFKTLFPESMFDEGYLPQVFSVDKIDLFWKMPGESKNKICLAAHKPMKDTPPHCLDLILTWF